jgi:single-strand DNA-binding protein
MANYNRIILVGNLTRDPQLRYLPSQMAVVDFGLAVNHRFKTKTGEDRDEVCFIDCSCFGRGAEVINQYCQKGRPLLVEGRLKLDTWDDKQTGQKRSKHTVVVDNFQLMGGRGDAPGGGGYQSGGDESSQAPPQRAPNRAASARPPTQQSQQPQQSPPPEQPFGEEQQFKEDDIPF